MSQCRAHFRDDQVVGGLMRCDKPSGHPLNFGHKCGEEYWSAAVAIYPHEPVSASEPDHDQVKAPEHYRFPNGAEVKDITQWLTFFRGSAVKYICRAGRKAGVDELVDLRKARECIDNEIQRLEAAQ